MRWVPIIYLLSVAPLLAATYDPPADRYINWLEYTGVRGGIPSVTTVYTTLGTTCTATQLEGHISNCPSNQVIAFDAGTFTLSTSIDHGKSGVVLRGATNANGFAATIFKFTGADLYGTYFVNGSSFNDPCCYTPPHVVNWTSGYARGESNIVLSSVSGLSVNMMIFLDQLNDNLLVSDDASEGNGVGGRGGTGGALGGDRCQIQFCRVHAINGTTVTIYPPLSMTNWVSGRTPQVWWFDGSPIEMVGLENIVLTNATSNLHFTTFMNARNCWMKNCESWNAGSASGGEHIRTYIAQWITVQDCLFNGTQTTASQSYGVNPYWAANVLCVNNVFEKVTSPIVLEQCTGSAFLYNFATNLVYTVQTDWLIEGIAVHYSHCSYNLFEGNHAPNIWFDFIHGANSHNFVFRGRYVGWEPNRDANAYAIAMQASNRCNTVVGNLFGKIGFHNRFERPTDGGNSFEHICVMGVRDAASEDPVVGYDSEVTNSVIRHMNYDVVTSTNNGIRYQSGVSDYNLRDSYFYTSKPSWFGFLNWPPYDPSLTNSSGIDPTNIPAGYRFWFGTNPPAGAGGGGGGLEHKPRARHNAASSRWR